MKMQVGAMPLVMTDYHLMSLLWELAYMGQGRLMIQRR
jgi:hypothetical protein